MTTTKPALPEPDGYFYEVDGYFGIHRQFDTAPYNGMRPHRTVGYFTADTTRAAIDAAVAEVNALNGALIDRCNSYIIANARLAEQVAEARAVQDGMLVALERAAEWVDHSSHGDNCYVSDHYDGDPGNRCNCGKESLLSHIADLLSATPSPAEQPKPAVLEAPDDLRGLDTATRVRFYEHDFYVLSNFSAFNLHWKGIAFATSEHAYHWEKFAGSPKLSDDGYSLIVRAVANAASAHEAFKIAERHKAERRADWDDVKVGIMRDILRAKAAQHEYVRRKLLATGDRELVEDSWRDDFWGWGPNRDGQNMLGKLWMEVRAELRAALQGEPHDQA